MSPVTGDRLDTQIATTEIFCDENVPAGISWETKRILERLFALLLLIPLLPLLAAIALAIKLESKGPVLFRQARFGKDAKPFNVIKFRTMKTELSDVSGANQTQDADPRITRVGMFLRRTSLDELPQIINVLRGEMNIIGPRAHPCGMRVKGELCEVLDPDYHKRHAVTPGITGWAQVNGSRGAVKSEASLKRRVTLDRIYIRDWSLAKDLQILVRTFGVLIHRGRGV